MKTEVVDYSTLSQCAGIDGKSEWDDADQPSGSVFPKQQRQNSDTAFLTTGRVAQQLWIGHRKGARGNSAEACFRDIKRHGPATEATRMSARSIVFWPDCCQQPSGSMRPLIDKTGGFPQIPPAELRLPCSLMEYVIPESDIRVTRLAESLAQNLDPQITGQPVQSDLHLKNRPSSSQMAMSPRAFVIASFAPPAE